MVDECMKKGKIAEKIVGQMFKEAGFKVIHSGYEKTFSQLADRYNLLGGPAGNYIRHYPDFIVINERNEAFFVEVKYRTFGIINQNDLFNYPATLVILLTKDSMHCQSLKEIHRNGKKFVSLDSLRPFSEIPLKIRKKYIGKTRRLLGDENLIGQLIEEISEKIVGKSFKQPYTPGEIKFTYIEDFNNRGYSYERTENKEIITDQNLTVGTDQGKQWDTKEIKNLYELYKSGRSLNEIAFILHRKKEAIIFKLLKERIINIHQAKKLIRGRHGPRKKLKPWHKNKKYLKPRRRFH